MALNIRDNLSFASFTFPPLPAPEASAGFFTSHPHRESQNGKDFGINSAVPSQVRKTPGSALESHQGTGTHFLL